MLAKFERFVWVGSDWSANVGTALLLMIFFISIGDVIGLKLFSWPVPGSTEIISLFQLVFIALTVAMTHLMRQHISVGILVDRLPKKVQAAISIIVSLFIAGLFIILVWQVLRVGLNFQAKGQYSITIRLPIYIFVYLAAVAFIFPCLAYLLDMFKSINELRGK
jgi:TRAP-type C4-dicarboxylate transport system permease small subunit